MMTLRKKVFFVVMFFALITVCKGYASEKHPLEGKPVPTFKLIFQDGTVRDFGDFIDKPTIIYFTHNSCWYCEQIVHELKRAEAKYGKQRLRIIGINVMARDERLVKAYKEALEFTFPMFAGNNYELLKTYRINYVPVIVFVDSRKIIRKVVGHYIHEPELYKTIDEIMK